MEYNKAGVILTETGKKIGSSMMRNSRLLEVLMDSALKVEVDEEMVCGIEHHMNKQFTDALLKYNSPVDIFYGEAIDSANQFQWTNIFLSLESRQEFIESWQSLKISREIQALLLEQSICQPSKMYRLYKVI